MAADRSEMEAARAAGLKARHEQRLENATYTATEVKVLTEAALRLARKEALDEAVEALRKITYASDDGSEYEHNEGCMGEAECPACWVMYIRDVIDQLQPSPDATSARTEAPGYSDLPQDSQAIRSPQEGV